MIVSSEELKRNQERVLAKERKQKIDYSLDIFGIGFALGMFAVMLIIEVFI